MKRFKHKGVTLAATAIAIIAWMFLSYIAFVVMASPFPVLSAARTARQAEQYAEYIASSLKLVNYDDLGSSAHARRSLANEINGANGWESRVSLSGETTIGSNTQRIATIDIFRQGDTLSRCSLQVPLSSAGSGNNQSMGFIDYKNRKSLINGRTKSYTFQEPGLAIVDTSMYTRINGVLLQNFSPTNIRLPESGGTGYAVVLVDKGDVISDPEYYMDYIYLAPLKKK